MLAEKNGNGGWQTRHFFHISYLFSIDTNTVDGYENGIVLTRAGEGMVLIIAGEKTVLS